MKIGDDSSIWCNTVLRGDVNRIVIGRGTNVQDLTMCHVTHKTSDKPEGSPLIIGDYVTVGHSVILHGCRIGNECLIGMGSIIMDDVVIPGPRDDRRGQPGVAGQDAGKRDALYGPSGQGRACADRRRKSLTCAIPPKITCG